MSDAKQWLKANRCPHCQHGCEPTSRYKVRETPDGWYCGGYSSKYWDEAYDWKAGRK